MIFLLAAIFMANYAIGDLQGCLKPLERLLEKIGFDLTRDRLWFAGDLVNRGPESLGVLRFVKSLGQAACCVLGNHDLHLLAAAAGHGRDNRSDTIADILTAPDRIELIDWLRHQPLAYAEAAFPNHLMVHAGVLPSWTKAKTLSLAREVETALQAETWTDFMSTLYGNQSNRWDEGLTGPDRWRVIVNALTRMRFCTADGLMEWKNKQADAIEGYFPWFDVPGRQTANQRLIVGHWSTRGLNIRPDLIAIDTGCVWGGCLTAFDLDTEALFQISCESELDPAMF
ncbi:MAG: symmetrical bis(5'-nucleosyl)-tetraphosphatase [Burkholderiaceae bacterium]